jgi:hypothetical protein
MKVLCVAATALLCTLASAPSQSVPLRFDVSINTFTFPVGSTYALDFQLNDGSGVGDANNTAVISNLMFGGGSAGLTSPTGGATGNAAAGFILSDTSFFNQILQVFVPGSFVSFRTELTDSADLGATPDTLTLAILRDGVEIPTTSLLDAFLVAEITGGPGSVAGFGSDASALPIDTGAPLITFVSTSGVPEPGSLFLVSAAIGLLICLRRRPQSALSTYCEVRQSGN